MKKRSIIAITLAVIMSAAAFAGCKPSAGSSSVPPSSEVSSEASSEAPKKATEGQLQDVFDAVYKEAFGEEGPAMEPLADLAQVKEFTGVDITADVAKSAMYALPMMNTQFQKFFAVEAVDGKTADVEKLLKDYQAKVIVDQEAFPYVDDTVEKAKAAQVITVDNYVFYICMANTAEMKEITQEKVNEATQKIVDAAKTAVKYE